MSTNKVLTPVTVLGTDSKVKALLPADRLRPQPVQGTKSLKTVKYKIAKNIQICHLNRIDVDSTLSMNK